MDEAAPAAPEIGVFARETGPRPDGRVSANLRGLAGSEILRIAGEIRALVQAGHAICDLTVGDFSPRQFPIPQLLLRATKAALDRGETNYPPAAGLPALREAVSAFYARELGLRYPVESVLVTSGARPAIYGTYRTLCDPGDRVVYPLPSWNNNHYTHLVGGVGVPLPTRPEQRFLPTREAVRAALPGARLVVLCSPLNPAGTVLARETLAGICEDLLRENAAREARGAAPAFLLYDQVYWVLTFGQARHFTPPGLLPEMARYTLLVDGISKSLAATGLRVGWVVGPVDVIGRMSSLVGHLGAWAPRAEQAATVELLRDAAAFHAFQAEYLPKVESRLARLERGFQRMKAEGLPVDCLAPAGAIYLAARIAPFGRRAPHGARLSTNESIRRYLLEAARVAVVPFQAFGTTEEDGWFRLSVGAVSEDDVEGALERLAAALWALA